MEEYEGEYGSGPWTLERIHAIRQKVREEAGVAGARTVAISDIKIEETVPEPTLEEIAGRLNQKQVAQIRSTIARITELDVSIVEAAEYSNVELAGLYNQASGLHNKIAGSFKELNEIKASTKIDMKYERRSDYTWGDVEYLENRAVTAVQIHARLNNADQALTRLTQGITTRALLRATARKPGP